MLRHLAWNQLKHVLHKMASWLFLTALSHSPQGYFGGTLFPLGPGLDEMSPQTSSFLSKLKLLAPLVVYWILHEVNRLTRDLDLRYVVEFRTSSVARSVWKTLPTCNDRDMITFSVFSLLVVAVINKKTRIRRELEQADRPPWCRVCKNGWLQHRHWSDHGIRLSTKVQVHRTVVLSTLLYGSVAWTNTDVTSNCYSSSINTAFASVQHDLEGQSS